jgi:hypothetical protein
MPFAQPTAIGLSTDFDLPIANKPVGRIDDTISQQCQGRHNFKSRARPRRALHAELFIHQSQYQSVARIHRENRAGTSAQNFGALFSEGE